MENIHLHKEDIHCGRLILVNEAHPFLPQEKETISLIPVSESFPQVLLESHTATVLTHILSDIHSDDQIVPVSGYRSLEEQTEIYQHSLAENGRDFTEKYVARPNHSEHQTGLAIDLALCEPNIDFIRPNFPYNGICQDFRKKASDFGFIERYQEPKEFLTGIGSEPWHFRYVGYPHSKIMEEQGWSLEEYIEAVKQYPFSGAPLTYCTAQQVIEIFYIPFSTSPNQIDVCLPKHALYQISGNNIDGFIVTVWRGGVD